MDRRGMLRWAVRGIGLVMAGLVGGPAVATLLSPVFRGRRRKMWQAVGPVAQFQAGTIQHAAVGAGQDSSLERGIYVWRREGGGFTVFSRACTDLACPITWDAGSKWFFCPCHGGIFDQEGNPVSGPPAYPLYRYRNRIRNGTLEVDVHSVPPLV